MKNKLILLLPLLLFFIGCSDSENSSDILEVSPSAFNNINEKGETIKINITSSTQWSISSTMWCTPDKASGQNNSEITFAISPNTEQKERTATIKITAENVSKSIKITQKAKIISATDIENYKYQLPVIFHVLYKDKNNKNQYIERGRANEIITACNKFYNNSIGSSTDLKVEFVLASEDPSGKTLAESGIDRIQVDQATIDCKKFMGDKTNLKYLWDTDRYINIMLYAFTNEKILGISHFPYTTAPDYLAGLRKLDFLPEHSSLTYPHCVSINNSYIYAESSIEGRSYNNTDVVATLAHELGHYLGLFHAFNQKEDPDGSVITDICEDTDYCEDTPPYNRDEYTRYLDNYRLINGKNITLDDLPALMLRTNCKDNTKSTPNNVMDYDISYVNRFTDNQKDRVRYVLTHSPLIPGPKVSRTATRVATTPQKFPMRMMQ